MLLSAGSPGQHLKLVHDGSETSKCSVGNDGLEDGTGTSSLARVSLQGPRKSFMSESTRRGSQHTKEGLLEMDCLSDSTGGPSDVCFDFDAYKERLKEIDTISGRVSACERLLEGFQPDNDQRWKVLSYLGEILYAQFTDNGQTEDLICASSRCREALSLRPRGSNDSERLISLHQLSIYTKKLFETQGSQTDLLDAIECTVEVESLATEIDHPYLTWFHKCIVRSEEPNPKDLDTPFTPRQRKTSYARDTAQNRFTDAVSLAVAAHDISLFSSAILAYKTAFHLAERCIVSLFSPTLQHDFLSRQDVLALPSRAASCAIQAGQLEVAVELLEQGRGQIWARLRDYSHPLSELLTASEELGTRFRELCVSLELLSMPGSGLFLNEEERSEYRKQKIGEWNELLKKIRDLDGFQGFLQPKTFGELRNAASDGPVIFINIDSSRSDAIIVQNTDAPCLVPLPQELARIVPKLSKVVAHLKGRSLRPATTKGYGGSLKSVAQDLWKYICERVVAQLRALGIAEQSHIWWCPTNHLTALPIHAAGPYRDGEKNLLDLYVSSYTTSLLSLLRGQINKKDCQSYARRQVQLLAVGQSNDLPKVKQELAFIQEIFGTAVRVLDGVDATQDTVERELIHYNIVHFACHGFVDVVRPFESYLALYLSRLSLTSIVGNATMDSQQMAFIAACHSAAGETGSSADEVITLAAAFQTTGFQSVIGTLWEMSDVDGPPLANDFYRHLLPDGIDKSDCFRLDSGPALHLAVKAMRERNVPIERWSTFVHIGV